MAVDESLAGISFPVVLHQLKGGRGIGFYCKVVDGYRGFVPPFHWPTRFPLRRGGIFDSRGSYYRCDGAIGSRPPIPLLTPLANSLALGGALFVAIYGKGSYGPKIIGHEQLSMQEYRDRLRDVIFDRNPKSSAFKDYVEVTDRKLAVSARFKQIVETVRWHILSDGGTVEMAPSNRYYGRTPDV
jgi:hypothetical protein